MYTSKLFFVLAAGLILTGCQTIPDGNPPPEKEIVTIYTPNTYSSAGAVNYLTTGLTTAGVSLLPPGSTVELQVKSGSDLKPYAAKVYKASQRILNFKMVTSMADFTLISDIKERDRNREPNVYDWTMMLRRNRDGVSVWNKSVIIDTYKAD